MQDYNVLSIRKFLKMPKIFFQTNNQITIEKLLVSPSKLRNNYCFYLRLQPSIFSSLEIVSLQI